MEIIKGNKVRFKNPKDSYLVTITTSESDYGDHDLKVTLNNNEDGISCLRELVICLEICSKLFPNGKPLTSSYDGVPYYDKYLEGNWFSYLDDTNIHSFYDYLKGYKILYYDEDGLAYKISVTNDEEMVEIITNFKVREK